MPALPFGMIRLNDLRGPQDCIQATQFGQLFWQLATTVPSNETSAKQPISPCSNRKSRTRSVSNQDSMSHFVTQRRRIGPGVLFSSRLYRRKQHEVQGCQSIPEHSLNRRDLRQSSGVDGLDVRPRDPVIADDAEVIFLHGKSAPMASRSLNRVEEKAVWNKVVSRSGSTGCEARAGTVAGGKRRDI
jgi:hypothetical protein